MAQEFKLPDPGEGIHEAEIVTVKVSAGEDVEESQVLFEVETDKAVVEVPSPFTGTVTEVLVEVGDRVEVGSPVLRYEEAGNGGTEEPHKDDVPGEEEPQEEEKQPQAEEKPDEEKRPDDEGGPYDGDKPDHDEGQGDESASEAEEAPRARSGERPVPAAPATRRLARELDVDLRAVEPSGPEGRVLPEDVRAAAEKGSEEPPAESEHEEDVDDEAPEGKAREGEEGQPSTEEPTHGGPTRREPLRSVRRTTAERLSRSWARIPHVTHFDHADITELERFRDEHAPSVEEAGGTLTLTVFVLKAAVAALKEYPRFNARFDDDAGEVVIFERHNLGLAVDTDRGLLVPVLRDVESMSLTELAVESTRLQERTQSGELTRDDMRGGSFTLTNPGPIGGTGFTPIINPPQVAILGTARASWEATVRGEGRGREVVPRKRLPLCLAFDHRVNDGADAARFVTRLVEILEDPDALVRHL